MDNSAKSSNALSPSPRVTRPYGKDIQNQSEGAQQISEAMWQLTETARQTSDSVNDLNDVSRQLHEAVRVTKEHIFKVTTEA